ncbi:MAG TPA: type II toxin-antitoxin system ParD family antitoxin [Pirellulales bacterium]|jgi:antitoxin ParD1/3/4|nr:type II toxin-antitoxin system ParD family antitoxin [Pirellulales bacterium]HEV3025149.1 type II toxin-antitoxin system ParD family antitoxin [Pirellulales bacterium]
MNTDLLNISLGEPVKSFVEAEVAAGGYGTASDYVVTILLAEQQRKGAAKLAQLIADGLNSGPSIKVDPDFWDGVRREIQAPRAGPASV